MTTSLEQLPVGAKARVERMQGGLGLQQHIQALGQGAGQVVQKLRHAGNGPILIEFGSQRMAIGRGIARRIKEIILGMIRRDLGWLVVWSGVLGGFVGLITGLIQSGV